MIKFLKYLIVFVCAPVVILAQSGKIVGNVTDQETGEDLIGANVIIEGTSFGAATDVNGDYLILNIPPGTYELTAKFIGYRSVTKQNIKVSVNLTTETDFALPSETLQQDEIVIVAPRELINKNITNQTSIIGSDEIKNLPVRGVNAIVGNQAGVVTKGGSMYVRGSRGDAVAYYVDGVLVNDPVAGGNRTSMISNAIEEIQVQAGGYSAEFGGANGGIISTSTKIGTSKLEFSGEAITDNFVKTGESFLGGYTYGYSEYVLTLGGPVIPNYNDLRFFFAGNNVFQGSPVAFRRGYNFPVIFDPTPGSSDTFSVVYPEGVALNQANNTYQFQGNINWDLLPFKVRLNGNYRVAEGRNGMSWRNLRRVNSAGLNENSTLTASLKLTHLINDNSFYDVIFNHFNDFFVNMDPIFKHNLALYGDSVANAQYGRILNGDSDSKGTPALYAYGLTFGSKDFPYNLYQKQRTMSFGGKINLLYQIGKTHELKNGVEFSYYTIRRYEIAPLDIAANLKSIADGDIRGIYDRLDNYGYDVFGNELNSGVEGPKHPVFAAIYMQDKMEFTDLVVNVGFRLDYIDIDSKTFENPHNIKFDKEGIIDEAFLVDVEPYVHVSPRLGFSFPVTEKTVFHAQYGKFIQQSKLRDVYLGFNRASDVAKGGFAELNPVGYGIKPERTTQYEIGFKQQLGENFAFDITGFYKDIKDQVQLRATYAEATANHLQYYSLVNGDFATIKGVELKLDMRRTERIAFTVDYTFSDAQGTGSSPTDAGRAVWQSPTATPYLPVVISPLNYNQTHRGALNLDYRFADDDGPEVFGSKILANMGLNFLFTFNSGFNYTRIEGYGNSTIPNEELNASVTPWTYQIDARLDKTISIGEFDFNLYLWVINLLNTKNVVNVFGQSGDPVDDGYLATEQGQAQIKSYERTYGPEYAEMYKEMYLASIYSSANFGTPRQIRLGFRIEY